MQKFNGSFWFYIIYYSLIYLTIKNHYMLLFLPIKKFLNWLGFAKIIHTIESNKCLLLNKI